VSDGDYVFEPPNPDEEAGIRQQHINVYADVLISLYGFTDADAENERNYVVATLIAYEPIDYDALAQRAQRQIVRNDLRAALQEHGYSDAEIDKLLRDYFEGQGQDT
jgi:hypothetical protein